MSDEELRALERAAKIGDPTARFAWAQALRRAERFAESLEVLRSVAPVLPAARSALDALGLARVTVLVDNDQRHEADEFLSWLEEHEAELTYVSPEGGCGCCVRLWDLEGPASILADISQSVRCGSDWTKSDLATPPTHRRP